MEEGPGAIAIDSLAAESAQAGGEFSKNRNSAPLAVSGSSSTFNTTDTSGATTLAPAPDAAERDARSLREETADDTKGPGGQKYPEGLGGQGVFDGQHNADGYTGGSTGAKEQLSQQIDGDNVYQPSGIRGGGNDDVTNEGDKGSVPSSNPDSTAAGTAPSYVSAVKSDPAATGKPKGKNITEGGFDSDPSNNASFNNEIGTENDPGRAAEQTFQTAAQSASGPTGPTQKKGESDNSQYDVLQSEQNL